MRLSGLPFYLALLLPVCPAAANAEEGMVWQFYAADAAGINDRSARLVYGVPETDNVQVTGTCAAASGTGENPLSLTFGGDIGDLPDGKDVSLRFSGGGFDHEMKGQIERPSGEEGLAGIHVEIAHDDQLWGALTEKASLDYLVPGYKAATLNLQTGKDKIESFVQACRSLAAAPTDPASPATATQGPGSVDAEKDAFNSAKELGTVEAWEAFLANYPAGFHADLARAYVKKISADAAPQPEPPPPPAAEQKSAPAPKPAPKKSATRCSSKSILIDGKCILKRNASTYCGPGYRLQGNKCVQGYAAPKPQKQLPTWQQEAIQHGCRPGMGWNPQEGCHEND
jgi:hypothetical protein